MSRRYSDLSEEEIAHRLKNALANKSDYPIYDSPYPEGLISDTPRPAAVLIPLCRQDQAWHVLFTRRTDTLPEHSGQVSFPGGRVEKEDPDPETAALREAWEEIGLNPADVRLLGRVNDFLTITSYLVTPVVGVIPWPYPLKLAVNEVSRTFTVPLRWLADPANHETQYRELPLPYQSIPVIYFHPYQGEIIWGASARFMMRLVEILGI